MRPRSCEAPGGRAWPNSSTPSPSRTALPVMWLIQVGVAASVARIFSSGSRQNPGSTR